MNRSMEILQSSESAQPPPCSSYHRSYSSLGKKHRKGRVINHKYREQDKQDTRKEIARSFLLSIPLDKNPMAVTQGKLRSLSKVRLERVNEDTKNISTTAINAMTTTSTSMTTGQSSLSLQRNMIVDSPRTSKRRPAGVLKKHSQPFIVGDSASVFQEMIINSPRWAESYDLPLNILSYSYIGWRSSTMVTLSCIHQYYPTRNLRNGTSGN